MRRLAYWWHLLSYERVSCWVAFKLPRRVALWTFIRVYACDGQEPGPDFKRVYDAWKAGVGE